MEKVNTHGLKINGLEAASSETRSYPDGKFYTELFYNLSTGEVFANHHRSLGRLTKAVFDDPAIIKVRCCWRHLSMQEIADAIYQAVSATDLRGERRATSERGVALETDYLGDPIARGDYGASCATGDWSEAGATGQMGVACATGERGTACATGFGGVACATGDYGAAYGEAGATGAISSGYYSDAFIVSDLGVACNAGTFGTAIATGERGTACASGLTGLASVTGAHSVATATGHNGIVIGALGCALFAVERASDGRILSVASGIVDGVDIKPDTRYACKGGKLVEDQSDTRTANQITVRNRMLRAANP